MIESQRMWQEHVRNACAEGLCLINVYSDRIKELHGLLDRPDECYVLQPLLDEDGKVEAIEPVCQAMEENLNQYCDQPPMVCQIQVAPKFHEIITFPVWKQLNPDGNRKFIERFSRTPWQLRSKDNDNLEEKIWQEEKSKIDAAFAGKTIAFSKGKLDLYNIGVPKPVFRLDYGTCSVDNQQLSQRDGWNSPLSPATIRVHYAPEELKGIYEGYFPLEGELLMMFLSLIGEYILILCLVI